MVTLLLNFKSHGTTFDFCLSLLEVIVDFVEKFLSDRQIEVLPE